MKKKLCSLLVVVTFGVCLFCGCGGKESSSEAWWLRLSNAVSKEKPQETQIEEDVTELSDAEEELQAGYWEFHALCGLGKEEVENVLGQELTLDEEEQFEPYDVYRVGDVQYWFFKEADALFSIQYTNLDAFEAEALASACYREMRIRYGDDSTYPFNPQIHDLVLSVNSDLESDVNDKKIEQYSEAWRQPYTREMEEKVKDYYATDKVRLSLGLFTPLYRDQGAYSVSISHWSAPLD